jgi:hypothetical protein
MGDDMPQWLEGNCALGDETGQVCGGLDSASGVRDRCSPTWVLYLGWWSRQAIDRGYRAAIHGAPEWLTPAHHGWPTGQDGGFPTSVGLLSNSPLMMRRYPPQLALHGAAVSPRPPRVTFRALAERNG